MKRSHLQSVRVGGVAVAFQNGQDKALWADPWPDIVVECWTWRICYCTRKLHAVQQTVTQNRPIGSVLDKEPWIGGGTPYKYSRAALTVSRPQLPSENTAYTNLTGKFCKTIVALFTISLISIFNAQNSCQEKQFYLKYWFRKLDAFIHWLTWKHLYGPNSCCLWVKQLWISSHRLLYLAVNFFTLLLWNFFQMQQAMAEIALTIHPATALNRIVN